MVYWAFRRISPGGGGLVPPLPSLAKEGAHPSDAPLGSNREISGGQALFEWALIAPMRNTM